MLLRKKCKPTTCTTRACSPAQHEAQVPALSMHPQRFYEHPFCPAEEATVHCWRRGSWLCQCPCSSNCSCCFRRCCCAAASAALLAAAAAARLCCPSTAGSADSWRCLAPQQAGQQVGIRKVVPRVLAAHECNIERGCGACQQVPAQGMPRLPARSGT